MYILQENSQKAKILEDWKKREILNSEILKALNFSKGYLVQSCGVAY
jgi:hypothetical protein